VRPVPAQHRVEGSVELGQGPDQLQLLLGVGGEHVDGDHHGHAEDDRILDLLLQVGETFLNLKQYQTKVINERLN
jgi:hypothetical protein